MFVTYTMVRGSNMNNTNRDTLFDQMLHSLLFTHTKHLFMETFYYTHKEYYLNNGNHTHTHTLTQTNVSNNFLLFQIIIIFQYFCSSFLTNKIVRLNSQENNLIGIFHFGISDEERNCVLNWKLKIISNITQRGEKSNGIIKMKTTTTSTTDQWL